MIALVDMTPWRDKLHELKEGADDEEEGSEYDSGSESEEDQEEPTDEPAEDNIGTYKKLQCLLQRNYVVQLILMSLMMQQK